jgi:AcrR family transcriptional regulator
VSSPSAPHPATPALRDGPDASAAYVPARVPGDRPGPAGGKRDQNRQRRTDDLCGAALAVARAEGLDRVTVEAVASRAGLSKAALYRYFDNLEAVMDAVFAPLEVALRQTLGRAHAHLALAPDAASLLAAYAELVEGLVAGLSPCAGQLQLYLQERHGPPTPLRAPVHAIAERVYVEALRLTWVVREHPVLVALAPHAPLRRHAPQITASIVIGAVHELVAAVLHGRTTTPPDEAAAALVDLMIGRLA